MRKYIVAATLSLLGMLSGCNDADVASRNVSAKADNFDVTRRIVFYNGITGSYMLLIEGACALGNNDHPRQLTVICKTNNGFRKHFLGLSDNVTYFVEHLSPTEVSTDRYTVVFKPSVIVPDVVVK